MTVMAPGLSQLETSGTMKHVLLQGITGIGVRGDVAADLDKKLDADRIKSFLARGVIRPAEIFEESLERVTIPEKGGPKASLETVLLTKDQEIVALKEKVVNLELELGSVKAAKAQAGPDPMRAEAVVQVIRAKDEIIRKLEGELKKA